MNDFGWLIVHSLWQFAVIAFITWMITAGLMRSRSASARYSTLVIALVIMTVCPIVTLAFVRVQPATVAMAEVTLQTSPESNVLPGVAVGEPEETVSEGALPIVLAGNAAEQVALVDRPPVGSDASSITATIAAMISPWLTAITCGWFVGVLLFASRFLLGWRRVGYLKRSGREVHDRGLLASLQLAAKRLNVRRQVQLLASDVIDSPVVVGAFKSIILIPTSFLGGVAPQHIEAIFAHELAHVRRYDYIVNLFQSLVETLFFYHPAVWWLSRRIRIERENCCDDLAAGAIHDPAMLSRALLAIEELRGKNLSPALGVHDGSLIARIRRLMSTSREQEASVSPGAYFSAMMVVMTLFASLAGFAVLQAADEPENSTERDLDSAPFVVQIDDTLSVELLAVMPHKSDASGAWQPDGTAFETAPDLPKVGFNSATQKLSGVNLFVRYVGLAADQRPTYKMPGVNTMWFPDEDGIASLIVVPEENVTAENLTIGIPDANWGPWRKLDGKAELIEPVVIQSRYREAYEAINIHSVKARRGDVMIRWAHDRDKNNIAKTELIAVDLQGTRHRPYGTTLWDDPAGITRDADIFDLALDDIDHFEYRLRPIRHRVTFEHVALRPKQETNVTSKVTTVPIAATDSANATFRGRVVMPDGAAASSKGYLHYQSRSDSGSYVGTVGEFQSSFQFAGPSGQSYLTYFADGFAPAWSAKFDVQPGDLVEGIVLRLVEGTPAEIHVQSQDGTPIAAATVIRVPVINGFPGGPIYRHKTDDAGQLKLSHFADVLYELRVEASGYNKLRTNLIKVHSDKPIVLTLQPSDPPTAAVRDADKPYLSLAPPADTDAQALGVRVHEQLTAFGKLPAALISTQSFTSYYGAPQGVLGLKDKRSLENLQAALTHRDFDKSLSTANYLWAWDDDVVVSTWRQKYVYEGEPYDQTSERTWDGTRGWWRDSSGSFGRYRRFADAFDHHYFQPTKYLHLGDHRFGWVERSDQPTLFVNSTIPVEHANYQSLPDEDFAGERCHVIRSIPREEQFWISQSTGRVRACLTFVSQGKFIRMHEMEATQQLAGRLFESTEAFDQWSQENLTDTQRVQLLCEFKYLHQANQHPGALNEFTDYREAAPGVELPMTEWWSSWHHEGKQFKYHINQTVVRDVSLSPDLQPLIEQALPNKGDKITDWRFSTPVVYSFDPDMAETEIHALVDAAQKERLESAAFVADALKPLKQMVGNPAPDLDGQWITANELPKERQGKPILLHFWATWCGPCKNDIPQLNRMAKNGWNIVGVHVPGTEAEQIQEAIADSGMEYPVLRGTETQGGGYTLDRITGYPVKMFPCCVLINKDGKVQAVGSLADVLAENR